MGGTGHCPLLHLYQHPEFHIKGKGILQSHNSILTGKRNDMNCTISEFFLESLICVLPQFFCRFLSLDDHHDDEMVMRDERVQK